MKRALVIVLLASGLSAALAPSSRAAPVDGTLPLNGFAAMHAPNAGATLDPLDEPAMDASSIARAWPADAYGIEGMPATFGRPTHGAAFAPAADFEALLRATAGRVPQAGPGFGGNPYFALGTWGGDGRDIVHRVIAADNGLHPSDYAATGYAVEMSFKGFAVRGGGADDDVKPLAPFDGDPLFIPNQLAFSTGTNGSSSGSGVTGGTTPGDNGIGTGTGDNGGTGGTGSGGDSGSGAANGNGVGNGDPGGTAAGPVGAPRPVPEPSGLALLLMAIPAVLLMNRRRALARIAAPAAVAAAALMFAPGAAQAQLRDWEQLCNGTGGATPEVIVEGCSAVIKSDDESLNNVAIAYNNRGNALRELSRFDEAEADYDNAIILAPSDPFPYRNRGVTYGLLGDYARALTDFNRAITLAPKYASAYLGRAFALEQLGNARAAAADFARAARLDPKLVAQVRAPQAAALTESPR